MAETPADALQALQAQLPALAARAMTYAMLRAEQLAKGTTAYHDRTGRLRNSTRAGLLAVNKEHVVGAVTAGAPDATGRLAASMEYAPYVELGTSKMAPRPFVHPALVQVDAEGVLPKALKSLLQHWTP